MLHRLGNMVYVMPKGWDEESASMGTIGKLEVTVGKQRSLHGQTLLLFDYKGPSRSRNECGSNRQRTPLHYPTFDASNGISRVMVSATI